MVIEFRWVVISSGGTRFTEKDSNIFGSENVLHFGWGGGYKNVWIFKNSSSYILNLDKIHQFNLIFKE